MLKAALAAQARGQYIFPVTAGAKTPHRLAGSWGETATNDINQIIHFWTNVDPNANIGVACKPSQLLVVDLDLAKEDWNLNPGDWAYLHTVYGARVDGEHLFDEMAYKLCNEEKDEEDRDSYMNTFSARTCRGGLHLYYRWPAHWPKASQASPVKGAVDVRTNGGTDGGYVLAPGSRAEGGEYVVQQDLAIALPPKWIRRLVAEKPQPPRVQRPRGLAQPSSGLFAWEGLARSVRSAAEGNRNNSLLWAARAMYSDGAPEAEAQDVLGAAARSAGLGDFEIQRTIQSAYRIQQQKEG